MRVTDQKTPLTPLYPPIEPFDSGFLKVADNHTLFYEQSGNPNGKPILFLHGGPGGGLAPFYRQFFDPKAYRIVLFDQRGSGKSTPFAHLENNTTWDLVEDCERIRKQVGGIEKWVVFGGSWGSTLALAYAEKYPEKVKALILRGIFALREKELLWFYQEGASWMFPDEWEKFLAPIPEVERGHLMSAYYRRLTGKDEAEKVKCAKAWSIWEMATSRLYVDLKNVARAADDEKFAVAFARIECHYFVNGGWFEKDGQLIAQAGKLKNIPGTIVQGRYDLVCPAKTAWDLHKAWPEAELHLISDAGHSAKEAGTLDALVRAADKYKDL
jgi:proline iminopeptidase